MKLKEIITESSISPTDELVHRLKKLSLSALDYESINRLMQHISKRHGLDIYGEKLHKLFVQKYKHSPNVWAKKLKSKLGDQDVEENFIGMDPQGVAEGLEHYDGIEISMEKEADEIMVKAMRSGGRELGHVLFVIDGEYLAPQDLEVDERYRGQGIAQTMYDYVKSKGYKIRRSGQQTDAGAGFWDKHKPGKNIWEQGVAENFLDEGLRVDVPNEEWLQDAIDYAKQKSPDRNGLPYMGKTTATVRSVDVPVDILKRIPGMRREQQNVRQADLAAIIKIMSDTGKLPLGSHTGEEYKPFINVAYDGSAWVNEGNHRIMAAAKLGWKTLPVEISYFDGGERVESGAMYPPKIGLGQVAENFVLDSAVPKSSAMNDFLGKFNYRIWSESGDLIMTIQKNKYMFTTAGVFYSGPKGNQSIKWGERPDWFTHRGEISFDKSWRMGVWPAIPDSRELWTALDQGKINTKEALTNFDQLVKKAAAQAMSAQQNVKENFADGKGPGRPGDSQRHGIHKHATMAELEKASHASGRKGQLARWQINMRNGHKK